MPGKNSIVFINQNAGYLMIDIINTHTAFEERSIITGKLVERNTKLDDHVKIEKIITYNRASGFKRLYTWTVGFLQILWLVKTRYRHSKLFLVTNPPFTGLLPLFCSNRFSILVFDVYPDVLVAYKFLKPSSPITKWWKKANTKIYKRADRVFTLSDGMKTVLSQYAAEDKIEVVPLWSDNSFLKPIAKNENIFLQQYHLENKFLVIYSGNLGHSHNIETIVEAAKKTTDPNIVFVIIGEGDKKKQIESLVKKYELDNCLLLPWQDVTILPHVLSAADIGVVTLGKEAGSFSIPSKTFSLLGAGAALLCIADKTSELATLLDECEAGKCFATDDVDEIVAYIKEVKSNKIFHGQLKENAIKASQRFTPANALKFVNQ